MKGRVFLFLDISRGVWIWVFLQQHPEHTRLTAAKRRIIKRYFCCRLQITMRLRSRLSAFPARLFAQFFSCKEQRACRYEGQFLSSMDKHHSHKIVQYFLLPCVAQGHKQSNCRCFMFCLFFVKHMTGTPRRVFACVRVTSPSRGNTVSVPAQTLHNGKSFEQWL